MSGVYINDMKMPKPGEVIRIYNNGEARRCPVTEQKAFEVGVAIPVPPHGRLGDLDRLEQMFIDIDNAPYSGFDGEEPFYSAEDAARIIRLTPTIIEAEE